MTLTPDDLNAIVKAMSRLVSGQVPPTLLGLQLTITTSIITIPAGTTVPAAIPNSNRVGIYFGAAGPAVIHLNVAPAGIDPSVAGFPMQALGYLAFVTPRDGVIPQQGWNVYCVANYSQFVVMEHIWRPVAQ